MRGTTVERAVVLLDVMSCAMSEVGSTTGWLYGADIEVGLGVAELVVVSRKVVQTGDIW